MARKWSLSKSKRLFIPRKASETPQNRVKDNGRHYLSNAYLNLSNFIFAVINSQTS